MPILFIPFALAVGVALVFGIASMPANKHTPQTFAQLAMGRVSMIGWLFAFGFAGALLATYIAPATFR